MADAVGDERRIVGGLAEDERALQHRLRVAGEPGCIDTRRIAGGRQRLLEVGLERAGVAEDARRARVAHVGYVTNASCAIVPTRHVKSAGEPAISRARRSR